MGNAQRNAVDAAYYGPATETARRLHDAGRLKEGEHFTFTVSPLLRELFGVPDKVYAVNLH